MTIDLDRMYRDNLRLAATDGNHNAELAADKMTTQQVAHEVEMFIEQRKQANYA